MNIGQFGSLLERYGIEASGVLHIGAHEGQELSEYAAAGVEHVLLVEPQPDIVQRLLGKGAAFETYVVYPVAAGTEYSRMTMYTETANGSMSSSLLKPAKHLELHPNITFDGRLEVDVVPLGPYLAERHAPLDHINIMNIDVQGYELPALMGLGDELARFDLVHAEVNRDEVYENVTYVADLDAYLGSFGLVREETLWVGGTYGDAVYVRAPLARRARQRQFDLVRSLARRGGQTHIIRVGVEAPELVDSGADVRHVPTMAELVARARPTDSDAVSIEVGAAADWPAAESSLSAVGGARFVHVSLAERTFPQGVRGQVAHLERLLAAYGFVRRETVWEGESWGEVLFERSAGSQPVRGLDAVGLVCVGGRDPGSLDVAIDSALREIGESLSFPIVVVADAGAEAARFDLAAESSVVEIPGVQKTVDVRAQAIAAAPGDWILVLGADLALQPGWGDAMSNVIASEPRRNLFSSVLQVGDTTYLPSQPLAFVKARSCAALVKRALLAPGTTIDSLTVAAPAVPQREWADLSDGVCIVLTGGVGSQLTQFAAGLEQADRLGCPLYLDASRIEVPSLLDYPLPAVDITSTSPWRDEPMPIARLGGALPSWMTANTNVVVCPEGEYVAIDDMVRPGTVMVGAFEDVRYFANALPKVLHALERLILTAEEQHLIDQLRTDAMVGVDLQPGYDVDRGSGEAPELVSLGFARRATSLLRRLEPAARLRVWPDSSLLGEAAGATSAPSLEGIRPSAMLLAMAESTGFVMSGSLLSWWAAALVSQREESALVIAPRPWRNGAADIDMIKPEWITVGDD